MDQVFQRMIMTQVVVTIIIAIAAFALGGLNTGLSAGAGGGVAILGGLVSSRIATGKQKNQDAGAILIRLIKAEAIKILVIVLLLWLVFKFYSGLVPIALILGLACAALLSGAAIFAINEK